MGGSDEFKSETEGGAVLPGDPLLAGDGAGGEKDGALLIVGFNDSVSTGLTLFGRNPVGLTDGDDRAPDPDPDPDPLEYDGAWVPSDPERGEGVEGDPEPSDDVGAPSDPGGAKVVVVDSKPSDDVGAWVASNPEGTEVAKGAAVAIPELPESVGGLLTAGAAVSPNPTVGVPPGLPSSE